MSLSQRGVALAVAAAGAVVVVVGLAASPLTPPAGPALPIELDAARAALDATPETESAPYRGVLLVGASIGATGVTRGRFERLVIDGARVESEVIEHPESDVVHVARGEDHDCTTILVAAGGPALLERWTRSPTGWTRAELWRATFGVISSRMRDLEIGPVMLRGERLEGDALVVGTHGEGVVAIVFPRRAGARVVELDREPNTLVHEIELGDVDGDGVLEIYATRSPPNTLIPGVVQPGRVVRYVPSRDQVRELIVDLTPRHAKEILTADLDDDRADELYVVVEALVRSDEAGPQIVEPVEVRRITRSRPAPGDVIARFDDRSTRFLAAGDVDGDGTRELVAATFSAGLWILRPAEDPTAFWRRELVDVDTGGYEHAITLADLDHDGADEIYAADDPSGELRRYVRHDGRWEREVIRRREPDVHGITWSLAACPDLSVPPGADARRVE